MKNPIILLLLMYLSVNTLATETGTPSGFSSFDGFESLPDNVYCNLLDVAFVMKKNGNVKWIYKKDTNLLNIDDNLILPPLNNEFKYKSFYIKNVNSITFITPIDNQLVLTTKPLFFKKNPPLRMR